MRQLGRLDTTRERRLVAVLFLVLHPGLLWASEGLRLESGTPVVMLTTGAALGLVLSLGPVSAPLVALAHVGSAVLVRGAPVTTALVVEAALTAMVVVLLVFVLEERFGILGNIRSPRLAFEFVIVACMVGPAVLALGGAAIQYLLVDGMPQLTAQLEEGIAHALGILAVAPGARMLVMREPLVVEEEDRQRIAWGVAGTVLFAAVTVLLAGGATLVSVQVVAIPLLLVGLLTGTAAYTVVLLWVTLASCVLARLVVDGPVDVDVPSHLSWWAIVAVGLALAAEGDRRRRATLKLGALFGYAAAPSAEVSADGRILQVNRAFAAMLGWRPEELIESDLLMLFATGDDGVGVEALIAGHRDEVRGQSSIRTRGGKTRMVRYVGRRLHDLGTGDGLMLIQLLDMTDEERRAMALERSNDALEQLGHRISHDLKQPLAAIAGYASTLRVHRDRLDDQTVDEMLDRLDHAARRVVDQLDAMVQSASLGGDTAEPVSLEAVAEAVSGLVDIELREAAGRIDTSFAVDRVHTEPRALQQVLLNLVSNALKYHDSGLPPAVRISSRVRAGGVEIAVVDNGPGIPHDALESVFEPGLRLAPALAQGRGMGLADSRRTIEDLGGWLRAEPSAAGARFVLWLPDPELGRGAAPVRTVCVDLGSMAPGFRMSPGPAAQPVDIEHERVVVVGRTDTMSDAVSLTTSLEPDVVFVDRWVADGDGLTALASLATAHPPARLVVRTRDGSQEAVRAALVSGATRAADQGADGRAVSAMVAQVAG